MSFGAIYKDVQALATPVALEDVRRFVARAIPGRTVRIVKSRLNRNLMQGYYISPRNPDTAYFGAPPGAAVIVLSEDLPPDWFRFVQLKELMHVFDDPMHSTNTPTELEMLLTGLCENADPESERSDQEQSEHECTWMALALVCPEEHRLALQLKRDSGSISDAEIAKQLELPERLVPCLFGEADYKESINFLLVKYP